jgi:hypothetical protein
MTATTASFDLSVTSTTGDLWRQSMDPTAAFTPVIVDPGQSAVIPVVVTPSGTPGTTETGTLYVDDVSATTGLATDQETTQLINQASDVVAIPYSYTIG